MRALFYILADPAIPLDWFNAQLFKPKRKLLTARKNITPLTDDVELTEWLKMNRRALQGLSTPDLIKAGKKAREVLKQRTAPNPKPYTWQMGYHHCIGRRPGEGEYPLLSGSSLNRLRKKVSKEKKPPQSYGIHILSSRSRSKVRDKATAFWRAGSGDRVFVTLTFIDQVTDYQGVRILNKFLTAVREDHPKIRYLWVAEHQPESGRIHFHCIFNKRLSVSRYNPLWVLQQYNAGLRHTTKYGTVISMAEMQQRYENGTVGKVCNPFDVEKIRTIHGISWYLTKYITKQKKDDPFGCQTWHCSRQVSRLFTREAVSPSAFRYMQSFENYRVDKETGECYPSPIYQSPFFIMTFVNNKASPLPWIRKLEQANKWILKDELQLDQAPQINDLIYRKIFCTAEALNKS